MDGTQLAATPQARGENAPQNGTACAQCEEHIASIARQQEAIERLLEDLKGAEADLATKRRKITQLKAELDKALGEEPGAPEAQAIFKLWQGACNKPKSKFLTHRKQAVLKALKHYGHERVAMAVIGASMAAYTNPKTGERFDDLELICRNESNIEKFERIAKRLNHAVLDERRKSHPFVNGVIRATNYQGMEHSAMEMWLFPCPVCGAGDLKLPYLPLIVTFDGRQSYCRECWADWSQIRDVVSTTAVQPLHNFEESM